MAEMLSYAPDLRSITGGQGRVHDGVPPLRGDPRPPRPEGRQGDGGGRLGVAARPAGRVAAHARHQDEPAGHLLRRVRADAAARRAGGAVPGRRRPPPGVRAVHRAGAARGVDPRVRRGRARAAQQPPRGADPLDRPPARAAGPRARDRRRPGGAGRRRGRPALRRAARPPDRGAPGAAAQPAPRARGADQRRAQDGARARRLQPLGPHPHRGRRRPLARGRPASACARWSTARASSPSP